MLKTIKNLHASVTVNGSQTYFDSELSYDFLKIMEPISVFFNNPSHPNFNKI